MSDSKPEQTQTRLSSYKVEMASNRSSALIDEKDQLDPKKLGGSGRPSGIRSSVTKSFRSNRDQGGFDDNDPSKGVDELVILSSSRPSAMASILSNALGEEKDEADLCYFLCIPVTNNVKALFIMMVMFASISLGQYFAAQAANSQSLKVDVISMAVDALSYLGNIIGEGSDIPAQRIVLQLFFSMVSLVLLIYFNTTALIESIGIVKTSQQLDAEGDGDDAEGVEGKLVIAFAGLGLVFDAICLYAYYYYAKKDAQIEYDEMMAQVEKDGEEDGAENKKATIKKPEINMLSALLHVSADLMRSTTTFIEGAILLAGGITAAKQEFIDAICGIIIGVTLYLGAAYALYEWVMTFREWFVGLGDAIVVHCPECEADIEIKPDKAGHGKVADAMLA